MAKYKISLERIEIYRRDFIVEAKSNEEAVANARKAFEQSGLKDGRLLNQATEVPFSLSTWYRPKGPATEKEEKTLPDMSEYLNPAQ